MPQIRAPKHLGVALDHEFTKSHAQKTGAGTYLHLHKNASREYRAGIADHSNMLLRENMTDNRLHDHKWQGNGFPGHVQFVGYLGREKIRPGVKAERDLQMNTFSGQNARDLNTTSMGRGADKLLFTSVPTEAEHNAHSNAMESIRSMRRYGEHHEKAENPHAHARNELSLSLQKQTRLADTQSGLEGLRTAGLASINPRLGTCGSMPQLNGIKGPDGMAMWRNSSPWALDHTRVQPAAWPRHETFVHPN